MSIIEDAIEAVRCKAAVMLSVSDDITYGNGAIAACDSILAEYRKRLEAEPPMKVYIKRTRDRPRFVFGKDGTGDFTYLKEGEEQVYWLIPVEEK